MLTDAGSNMLTWFYVKQLIYIDISSFNDNKVYFHSSGE